MSGFSGKNIYVNSLDETRGVITWNNGNIYIGGIKVKDGTYVRDGRGIMKKKRYRFIFVLLKKIFKECYFLEY